jgi:hypothetical protein
MEAFQDLEKLCTLDLALTSGKIHKKLKVQYEKDKTILAKGYIAF